MTRRVRKIYHFIPDLERIQRCHVGLDDEEMEFSAETVADMLQSLAEDCADGVADECADDLEATLYAMARALRGEDENHVLLLQQKKNAGSLCLRQMTPLSGSVLANGA